MEEEKSFSELIKQMSIKDIVINLEIKVGQLKELVPIVSNMPEHNERRLADSNILTKTIKELQRIVKDGLDNESLAYATRNIFELNLIYRYTSLNEDNLKTWWGNKLYDEIEIYEGILRLSRIADSDNSIKINGQICLIRKMAQENNITISKQLSVAEMAKRLNLDLEYKGLYKLYSKFVHPTSWLINTIDCEINSLQYKNILLLQLQTYLYDLEARLTKYYQPIEKP